MPRLFISHSSRDNIPALAFQRWLIAGGWAEEDIFLDLHDIGAGERWRDTLRKANASCEAVLLLASPDSLDSPECQRELNLAEDLGKEIIVAILRDLPKNDPRLARFADRQFVDLSLEPLERMEPFERDGALHRVHFHLPALNAIAARLAHLGIAPGSFKWQPKEGEGPYPGLAAFGEEDAGIFFGREADIMAGLTRLRQMRKRHSPRLLVIQAASGAGKSSFLRAGLWPRLKRDTDFAPLAIIRPALGIISGPDGLGRAIAPWFQRHGQTKVPGEIVLSLLRPGAEAAIALASLFAEATQLATTDRRAGSPEARPPASLIAIDQGEELFAAENAGESDRFLELLAAVLKEPPADVDPYVLVTIRADSVEALLQRWPSLGLDKPETEYLPPLAPSAYRDVIVKPAQVYAERVHRLDVEPALVDQLTRDAQGADALPLLAFTLESLFHQFNADGQLTAERYAGMGGIGGSIDRALTLAKKQAGPAGSDESLKRLMVPGLATWDMAANAAKRIVANEAELLSGNRASLAPLADALVANRLLTRGGSTVEAVRDIPPLPEGEGARRAGEGIEPHGSSPSPGAARHPLPMGEGKSGGIMLEVAHEALLRRPLIAGWLEAQKDNLKLRDDVLREAKEWADSQRHDKELVRRGVRLEAARMLQRDPDFAAAFAPAGDFLAACTKQETASRRRARRTRAAIYTLLLGIIAGLVGFINQDLLKAQYFHLAKIKPYVLTAAKEAALKPGDPIRECADASLCPEMVVVPAGKFLMGSKEGEGGDDERPQHEVTIAQPFAVGKFELTFDQWSTCVDRGGCKGAGRPGDKGWGRDNRPVINVSWEDAQEYVKWLSTLTGKSYRLLSEAEWEYAARAGSTGDYSFEGGEDKLGDYAWFLRNSDSKTHPVGEKKPNAFGLYDMHGNVWEWVEDWKGEYSSGPQTDPQGPSTGRYRVGRGGSWRFDARYLRSAYRSFYAPGSRSYNLGFRLARTL